MEAKEARKVAGGEMANMGAVRLAKDLIMDQFGSLDDLPKDMAAIIANVYFKFAVRLLELKSATRMYMIAEPIKKEIRQFGQLLGKILDGEPYILSDLKTVIEKVKSSRKQDKESGLKLTDSNVELILKNLKSNGINQSMAGTPKP